MKSENKDVAELGDKYLMPTYARQPIALIKGQGAYVWDADGNKYLDFVAGIAVNSLGHCHSLLADAVKKQCTEIMHCSNLYWIEKQVELAQLLVENSDFDKAFFCNSGAEANEGAIKLVRRYMQTVMEKDRDEIITFKKSFHGRTIATATATAQEAIHSGFDPLPAGFVYAPFNDLEAFKNAVGDRTCAVMLEPIQGEGGINVADTEFLKEVRKIANENNILLILDEIQCGMGRTGRLFAYEHYGIKPDVITLAKALGGGIPIGAILATEEVSQGFPPGSHGSTFGGNPVSCAAGAVVMKILFEEELIDNAAQTGEYFKQQLFVLGSEYSFVKEVRGIGLMLGMELGIPGADIVNACRERGLLINCTAKNVLRFLPPLIINRKHVDEAISILGEVLAMQD